MKKGKPEPDTDLRDQENIPLPAGWFDLDDDARAQALLDSAEKHLTEEIRPYVPDAWIDHDKTKLGFEIPFTRQFYVYTPPRPVEEMADEIIVDRTNRNGRLVDAYFSRPEVRTSFVDYLMVTYDEFRAGTGETRANRC